jgi:regulatory protein
MQSNRHHQGENARKAPMDAERLKALAFHYAARFATTQTKLARYLERKLSRADWSGASPPDIPSIVARMAELKLVDDEAFATMRTESLRRRGMGDRRIRQTLWQAGLSEDLVNAAVRVDEGQNYEQALASAHVFARRKRIGPYAEARPDPAVRKRQMAMMCRAGHDFRIACEILEPNAEFVQDD